MIKTPTIARRPGLLAALAAMLLLAAGCGTTVPSALPSTGGSQGSASASPSAVPTPLPEVELPGEISADRIREHLEGLQQIADRNGGLRTAGTPGYAASVDYVADQLRSFGYEVETPSFVMATYRELAGSTIVVEGRTFTAPDDFKAMIYSSGGDVTAFVDTVGYAESDGGEGNRGCSPADWEGFTSGSIALTPGGPCLRRDEVMLAQEAGAAALVVAYPEWAPGEARRPTLIQPDGIEIAVLSAIGDVGSALSDAADAGSQVRIHVRTEIGTETVRNVIAETGGDGPVAMLGAHLDSVHDGPGINDNGSGSAAVLEIARVLAGAEEPGSIRVAFWAGEEFGLLGSRDYVTGLSDAERERLAGYLNLDMLGSLNGVPIVYRDSAAASGSSGIGDYLHGWLRENGVGAEFQDLGGGSDHYFFEQARIPTGGIFSGATERKTSAQADAYGGQADEPMDACYHLACDTSDNVDVERVALYAGAAARAALLIERGELGRVQ